jgi:hypothetical protein
MSEILFEIINYGLIDVDAYGVYVLIIFCSTFLILKYIIYPLKSGFGWGRLWIISAYIVGMISLILFITLDSLIHSFGIFIPNHEIYLYRTIYLIQSILLLSSARSLQIRHKNAIYIVYTILIINSIGLFIFLFIDVSIVDRVKDLISIFISYAWYLYFNKRRELLTNPVGILEENSNDTDTFMDIPLKKGGTYDNAKDDKK